MNKKLPVDGNVTPYNERIVKDAKRATAKTKKTMEPVAKDTNKTRRKMVKPTSTGIKGKKCESPVYRKGKHGD